MKNVQRANDYECDPIWVKMNIYYTSEIQTSTIK